MSASNDCILMQAALGNPNVQEVFVNPTLQYVLVVLAPETSQAQLEAIQPNYAQLRQSLDSKHAFGVIVTCAGRGSATGAAQNCCLCEQLCAIWHHKRLLHGALQSLLLNCVSARSSSTVCQLLKYCLQGRCIYSAQSTCCR